MVVMSTSNNTSATSAAAPSTPTFARLDGLGLGALLPPLAQHQDDSTALSDETLSAIADAITTDDEDDVKSISTMASVRRSPGPDVSNSSELTPRGKPLTRIEFTDELQQPNVDEDDFLPPCPPAPTTNPSSRMSTVVQAMVPNDAVAYDIPVKHLMNNAAYRRVMDTIRRNRPKTSSKVNLLDLCSAFCRTGKCRMGDACTKLHPSVKLSELKKSPLHFSAAISSLAAAPHACLPPGVTITVWNSTKTSSETFPSESLYLTKGSQDAFRHVKSGSDAKIQMQHCSHFESGMCSRAVECNFIHAVHVDGTKGDAESSSLESSVNSKKSPQQAKPESAAAPAPFAVPMPMPMPVHQHMAPHPMHAGMMMAPPQHHCGCTCSHGTQMMPHHFAPSMMYPHMHPYAYAHPQYMAHPQPMMYPSPMMVPTHSGMPSQ